jgi:uncharacterized repeat protein (TIGR03803 family)
MTKTVKFLSWISSARPQGARSVLTLTLLLASAGMTSSAWAQNFKVLHTFTGGNDGGSPLAGLIGDARGNLYGSAGNVVFKIDRSRKETVLNRGFASTGPLVRDAAGNLYGTAYAGGSFNRGTVFEVEPSGKATVLYAFTGGKDGAYPAAGLIMDKTGNLYGTTFLGGSNNFGTVFTLRKSGKLLVLHSFAGRDGSNPYGSLIRDVKGNLYGTTEFGGRSNQCAGTQTGCGVVFKLASTGRETVLYAFTGGADGSRPLAGLVRDEEGNFYGTTVAGGASGAGTVFKLDNAGKETVLHSFSGPDGVEPSSPLVRDPEGNLYGTALDGGPSDTGTLFKVDATGAFTVLHNFDGAKDGYFLQAGLFRDANGVLYGATELGGRFGFGTVFKLTP